MLAGVRRFCRYQVDSGWAWVVCVASFFVQCVVFGTIQSFGTLFISLLNDFKSGESATAWVGSLGYGFLFVIGPVTTALCEHFGCRVMACAGSVLTTFSLLVTSFAPSIASMYFTFGVLWGTGGSFLFFSGLLILRFYFNRNICLANGITMTGAGFGTLVFNVTLQELDDKYGWRGGMRVLSVFSALTFLCGCAYIPPPADYLAFERPRLWFRLKRLIDPRPWRDRAFTMWVLSLSFILFAYFFPYTYLVRMAITLGVPLSQGALLLGYFSVSAIFGKLLCGRLADLPRVRRLYIFVFSAVILSLSSMCVTAAKSYHGLLAYTLVAGFFDGCFVVTVPLITQDIVGKELMAKAIGNLYGVVAFPLTLGPPVLGELYKTTNSFTTAFFVSSCFVLVGVSIIFIVQRIRPDLIRKQEHTRQEVYDASLMTTPSIHSASVVDTLSGMFVTEPGLSASHLDAMEISSYQRFDSFRPEYSRATFLEPVHGRMANPTEIEAVYRQAVDNLSNISGVTGHHLNGSDVSGNSKANVFAHDQSPSGSIFSGTMASSSEMPTIKADSSSDLQILSGETNNLPEASESSVTLVDPNIGASPQRVDEGGISISGDSMILQEGEQQEEVSVIISSPTIDIQTALEVKCIEQADSEFSDLFTEPQPSQVAVENSEGILPVPLIVDNRDIELEIELVKLPPPPDIHRKRRADPLDTVSSDQNDVASISSLEGLGVDVILKTEEVDPDVETIQDSDQSARTPVIEAISLENREGVETEGINGLLELVRIPPPPSVPRTGQLVALESEVSTDWGNTCVSELKSDAEQDIQNDKEVAADNNSSCGADSTTQRKQRLHLAIIDQLTLLSERLEAVAARQIREEEEHGGGDEPDQRPPFSPALQSLPLTPLYSANHSVPLTPACAWSSCLNTPAPTPRQTPPSAFLTTAPTSMHTSHTPAQIVSGIGTPSDVFMANPSRSNFYETRQVNTNDSNNLNNVIDVCSPSPSQEAVSRQRSRCSSFSETGQEFVLDERSVRDLHGTTEAFSSKPSSGANSLVSNSDRSIGDLNSASEPIDIVELTINESHRGHMNSPEIHSPNQQVDTSVDMCLPQKPCLNYENTDAYRQHPFQQSHLNSNLTELQTDQMNTLCKLEASNIPQQLGQGVLQEELVNSEMSLTAHTCQQFNTTDAKENEHESVGSTVQNPDIIGDNYQPEPAGILSPEVISNASTTSAPQKTIEYRADSRDMLMKQTRFDPIQQDSELNPFLESDQKELVDVSQYNPFQQPSERLLDGSENPFQIPSGLGSHGEQSLPFQSNELIIGNEQDVTMLLSETGQEFVLDERSVRDLHGTTEAFSSKPSSGANSLVSNSDRSIGDLNSASEPVDIVELTINESHRGHMNSPEIQSPNQQVDASVDMCLPQKPCLNYENREEYREDSRDMQMKQTRFDPIQLDPELNPFLESDQKELVDVSQYNPFQQPSERLLDGSENPFQIPSGLGSHGEQCLPFQSNELIIGNEQDVTTQIEVLTRVLPKLNLSPEAIGSHCENYCAENFTDQQLFPEQDNFIGETFHRLPEESDTGIMEPTFTTSDSTKRETDQELINRSQWTMFSQSEEDLNFEMDTESESSSGSGAKLECNSATTSKETKAGNKDRCTADQESLFPPLQIFSDVADMITTMNGQGIPVTLPPPPKAHRKRADTSVSVTKEQSLPREIGGKDSDSRQKPVVVRQVLAEAGLASSSKVDHEHHGILKLMESGNIETYPAPSDEDLSATSNSVSEIESDLLSESRFDGLPHKLGDNSICGIVCQELKSINDADEMFAGENADDSNTDGEMAKTSTLDDIVPLLVPNNETIQYVNLGDLPKNCLVLHKRPSSTSSTDDSSTSTDSSLSENEMPYSKLHDDTPAVG